MNKKKIATLLLVGTLVVGGGVLGTKAWFTSKADATSNLRVTMGTLKLVANGDDAWTVGNQTGDPDMITEIDEISNGSDTVYTNVRPGDEFVKNITLKNVGSLKSRTTIKLDQKVMPDRLKDKVILEIKEGNNNLPSEPITMQPNEEKKITIAVKLDGPAMENEFQNRNELGTNIGIYHEDLVKFLNSDIPFIEIDGTQVNAK